MDTEWGDFDFLCHKIKINLMMLCYFILDSDTATAAAARLLTLIEEVEDEVVVR